MVASAARAGCAATTTHRAVAANTSAVPTADLRNDSDPRKKNPPWQQAPPPWQELFRRNRLYPMDLCAPVKSGPARERPNTAARCLAAPGVTSKTPGRPASSSASRQRGMARTPRMRAPRTDVSARQSPGGEAQPRTPAPGRRACHSEKQALPFFAAACHKEIPLNEIEIRRRRTPVARGEAQPRTPAPGRRACHSEKQALPFFAAACHKEIPLNEIEIRRRRTPVREPHEQSVRLEATSRPRRIVTRVSARGCSAVTGNRRKF